MPQIKLNPNQAALILSVSEGGEVEVNMAYPKSKDADGNFAAELCMAIGRKLTTDEQFQAIILDEIEKNE